MEVELEEVLHKSEMETMEIVLVQTECMLVGVDLTHLSIKTPHPVSAGTATLPLFEGMPYNQTHKNSNDGTRNVNTDGANGPKQNYQGGYFVVQAQVKEMRKPEKVGGGIGTRRRNGTNWSAETTRNIGIAWPEGSTTTLGAMDLMGWVEEEVLFMLTT